MRPYEGMAIFEATTEPAVIQGVLDRALEVIRTTGGAPGAIDRWGKRTFAYEVNHKREGYYVVVEFTSETQTVADLDRMLGLADEVNHKREGYYVVVEFTSETQTVADLDRM